MPTETSPPRPETDEDLLSRAPAHDGVATQRDLRETERYLADRFDARLADRIDDRFDRIEERLHAKLDRLTWLALVGFSGIAALALAIALRI